MTHSCCSNNNPSSSDTTGSSSSCFSGSCCSKRACCCSLIMILIPVIVGGLLYIAGQHIGGKSAVKDPKPMISVTGEGKVYAAPDIVEITFGIQTGRQKTSQAAMEKLGTDMEKIITAVKEGGVAPEDIRTEYLSMNPAYDWVDGVQVDRGYEASQSLVVKVREIAKLSSVLGVATGAGANQVGGVNFTIDDPEKLMEQAREMAIAKAKEKAQLITAKLGTKLGKLTGYSDGGYAPSPIYMDYAKGMGGGGGAPPVPAGQQEISMSVTLTYEMIGDRGKDEER